MEFELAFTDVASSGTLQLMKGDQSDCNMPATPGLVTPETSNMTTGKTFSYLALSYSVGIITVKAS